MVAPAYLLSELTTALLMGFYVYLPFLVIDLVVSSVLAATGLFMLPPALVATPVKLIVFVLADGWLLIATMLLSSFASPRRSVNRTGWTADQHRQREGRPGRGHDPCDRLVARGAADVADCWEGLCWRPRFLVGLLVNVGQTLTQLHEPVVG